MNTDTTPDTLFTLGQMARLGLIKSKNNGGAIKNKSNLTVALKGQPFQTVETKYGPAKCLTKAQIDAYNAGVSPRWKKG